MDFLSGLGGGEKYDDDSVDLFQYFNSTCYTGFGDEDEVRIYVGVELDNVNYVTVVFSKNEREESFNLRKKYYAKGAFNCKDFVQNRNVLIYIT